MEYVLLTYPCCSVEVARVLIGRSMSPASAAEPVTLTKRASGSGASNPSMLLVFLIAYLGSIVTRSADRSEEAVRYMGRTCR